MGEEGTGGMISRIGPATALCGLSSESPRFLKLKQLEESV